MAKQTYNDLHAHITGTLNGSSIVDLIFNNGVHVQYRDKLNSISYDIFGIKLADTIIDDLEYAKTRFTNLYPCPPNGTKRFADIMRRFVFLSNILKLIPNVYTQVGEIAASIMKSHGVNYVEWRIDPFSSTPNESAEEGLCKLQDLYDGLYKVDLHSRFVLSFAKNRYKQNDKHAFNKLDYLREQLEVLLCNMGDLPVVGIDVANVESTPISVFEDVFLLAKEYSLGVIPHVGECTSNTLEDNLKDIEDAVTLHADRLGHAVSVYMNLDNYCDTVDGYGNVYDSCRIQRLKYQQDELLHLIKEKCIAIEVCPTSNLSAHLGFTAYADHPLDHLIEYNIPFVVCTDDYGIFGKSTVEEIDVLVQYKNVDRQLVINNSEIYALGI